MNTKLFICARFQAKPDSLIELRNRLFEMVDLTSKEEGCIFYNLHIDSGDESVFYFFEGWKDEAAFKHHESTTYVQAIIADAQRLTVDGVRVEFMHRISPT
jgi:quinol monooxygenase YgiN